MSASLKWEGLDEYRAALRALPADLAAEGASYVKTAADLAVAEIDRGYEGHVVSGDLIGHVIATGERGDTYGARYVVKSTSKHAWLFEHGSQARRYNGADRGTMPARPVVVPAIMRARRGLNMALANLLARQGFTVTGRG